MLKHSALLVHFSLILFSKQSFVPDPGENAKNSREGGPIVEPENQLGIVELGAPMLLTPQVLF